MKNIQIDTTKCIGCGLCVKDCGVNELFLENGKAHSLDIGCIECGHCYSICPQGAVSMLHYDCSQEEPVGSFAQFDEDEMLRALKSRRTVRHFKDKPVTEEQVLKIIEAGRYSPTATNIQNVRFTVLTGETMAEFERVSVATIRRVISFAKPFSAAARTTQIPDDFLFRHAPVAILVTAKTVAMDSFGAAVNGGLATAHMETQAESMGLGVLISGFTIISLRLSCKARRIVGLQRDERPIACLVLGYPVLKHRRIPPRKPANVKILK